MRTTRDGSRTGMGLRASESSSVKAVVLTPMPAASVRISASVSHGARELAPLRLFDGEQFADFRREPIHFHLAASLGLFPPGGDQPAALEPLQRGVERAVLDLQDVFR